MASKVKSHKYWHRLLDDKYRGWFRENNRECAMCGNPNIQVNHIYSKGAHQGLRYDPINTIPLCGGCHRFKWHDDVGPAWEWFKKKFPERYSYLQKAIQVFIKRDTAYYERINKALDDRDIKELFVLKEML